jgi:hypothetical protein
MSDTRLDGTTVNDDRRTVVANGGHEATWHVFVASRDRYITVIMLGLRAQV